MRIGPVTVPVLALALAAAVLSPPVAQAATGDVTGFPLQAGMTGPSAITSTSSGDLWVTLKTSGTLASLTTAGAVTARPVAGLSPASTPAGITQDGAGRLWFTEQSGNAVSSVSATGADLQRVPLPKPGSGPTAITLGPDGNLWVAETSGDRVASVTPKGVVTEFALPDGAAPAGIAPGVGNSLVFTMPGTNAIGRITTAGAITTTALPGTDTGPRGIVVDADGNAWFTQSKANRIGRLSASGSLAEFTVPTPASAPWAITLGADGNVWFTESAVGKVARITPTGQITEFSVGSSPIAIAAGADGNIWVAESANRVSRVLTGVVPTSTTAPAITGPSTAAGATLTASTGAWAFQPTSYGYQWQRCTTADAGSCADIAGATSPTWVVSGADAGTWLRVAVRATNANGPSAKAAVSALLQMGAKPVPPPVVGGTTVALAPGVTATFRAVNRTKRAVLRSYRVTINSGSARGKVRMTLVNAVGTEVLVIAKGRWVRATGPTAIAKRWKRIPRRIAPGVYNVRAVFTPHPDQRTTLASATMIRTITVR